MYVQCVFLFPFHSFLYCSSYSAVCMCVSLCELMCLSVCAVNGDCAAGTCVDYTCKAALGGSCTGSMIAPHDDRRNRDPLVVC